MTYRYAQLIEYYSAASSMTSFSVEGTTVPQVHNAGTLEQLNALGQDGWELVYQTAGPANGMSGDFRTVYWLKQAN